MLQSHIYLDHSATTPVDPQVVEAMLPFWTGEFGNPSSIHRHGRLAQRALDQARATVAHQLGAHPHEIVFTGCGSESDNLAIRGAMWAARQNGRGDHLIIDSIEHEAVLETARQLSELHQFDVTILGVDEDGKVDVDELRQAIRPNTALISIMAANNEIGTIQPIDTIGDIARQNGILYHTDAIQAGGYMKWDLHKRDVDLLSLAPHKFYGPKGVGILYVRDGTNLSPTLTGGGQESGWRAGTVNVAFAAGAAESLSLAMSRLDQNVVHCTTLRDRLIDGVLGKVGHEVVRLTGHRDDRLPHHASFAFRNISGNDLIIHLDVAGISASSGSACKTGNPEPSSVLEAIGLGSEWTTGGLRLTIGQSNDERQVDYAISVIPDIVSTLAALSPLSI